MKAKRILFSTIIASIGIICIFIMNTRFDALARYAWYGDLTEQQKTIIYKELDSKALNYIIDYSIAPAFFMDFIELADFNIYSIADYRRVYDEYQYRLSREQTISLVNLFQEKKIKIDTLYQALSSDYSLEEIYFYLDYYVAGVDLVSNPRDYLLELSEKNTLGNYQPKTLVLVEGIPQTNPEEEIFLEQQVAESLSAMCSALKEEFETPCGGLKLKLGYLSFDTLIEIQSNYNQSYYGDYPQFYLPGSSYFQLGVSVLFSQTEEPDDWFTDPVIQWLWENAHTYKFSLPIPPSEEGCDIWEGYPYYYRYIGVEQDWKEYDTAEGSNVCGV